MPLQLPDLQVKFSPFQEVFLQKGVFQDTDPNLRGLQAEVSQYKPLCVWKPLAWNQLGEHAGEGRWEPPDTAVSHQGSFQGLRFCSQKPRSSVSCSWKLSRHCPPIP